MTESMRLSPSHLLLRKENPCPYFMAFAKQIATYRLPRTEPTSLQLNRPCFKVGHRNILAQEPKLLVL